MKGKLIEYLKLLSKGLEHPDKVIEGWINDLKLTHGTLAEDEVEEILRRRIICEACPFMSVNAIKDGNYQSSRPDKHCTLCLCPIDKKTASLSSNCGAENYNMSHKGSKIELRWEAYIKPKNNE